MKKRNGTVDHYYSKESQEWMNAPMGKPKKVGWMQKLFKPYIVRRKNGQCQVLIPLVELDELCEKIERTWR